MVPSAGSERARAPFAIGRRGLVLLLLLGAAAWAYRSLDLHAGDLILQGSDFDTAMEFLSRAVTPAVRHESGFQADTPLLMLSLQAAGASGVQVFAYGLVPAALPDMTAYTFYRFECALRSATVIGFFGSFGAPPTLGRRISEAFGATDYGEAWTHLWMLILLVIVFDWWSGALRKRIVG